ncbi:MAG: hypothetical protein ACP5PX_04805 [Candidatus Hadarchaeum sp.]|uniref:hypothetical protein n=1 Tax=Candidatus Hadarchaeum sp. TaxID=2883567 RepID=UPI003D0C1D8D
MDITAKLTLTFSGAGILAGIISAFLPNAWLALLFAFIFLGISYKLTTSLLKRGSASPAPSAQGPAQTPPQAPPQPVKQMANLRGFRLFFATLVTRSGPEAKEVEMKIWFWPYYIMWFIFWVMTYTIMLIWWAA